MGTTMTRHKWLLLAVVRVAVAGTLVLGGCGSNERRGPVVLTTATLDGAARLLIEVPSCNGDPVVTELVQESGGVTVAATGR